MTTKAAKEHEHKVKALGCAMCYHLHGDHEPGEVEGHHLRGGGWGRGDHMTLIGLCWNHHQGKDGIHHLGTKAWAKRYGITQQDLLDWVLKRLEVLNA